MLCGTAAQHLKTPTKRRKPHNYSSEIGKTLALQLRGCIDIMQYHQCDELSKKTREHGVPTTHKKAPRTMWSCSSIEDIIFTLEKERAQQKRATQPRNNTFTQYDMGSMYTSLTQELVVQNSKLAVSKAFSIASQMLKIPVAHIRLQTNRDSRSTTFGKVGWSEAQIHSFIEHGVQNSMVQNGEEFFLQKAGLGMGTHAAAELATLCLGYTEEQKVTELLKTCTRPERILLEEKLDHIWRYIDY
jgi:hypothetical protein